MPLMVNSATLTHNTAPSARSRGSVVNVANGQRSRYAYTSQAVNMMQVKWRVAFALAAELTTSETPLSANA